MEVTVYSAFDGYASGYITFNVSSHLLVGDLLELYCRKKGIEPADDYVLCGKENFVLDPYKTLKDEGIHNGDCVKLTRADDNMLFAYGSWWVITLVAFVIGLCGLSYALYLFFLPQESMQKYGLVIDAGSTHSQLFVFSWSKVQNQETGDVELIHDCIMSGGIADFRYHLKDLHKYFGPCLGEAEEMVPPSNRPGTPLILAATAGMRILRAYDPVGAHLVLTTVREFFMAQSSFRTRHKDVFVATGQQEGINGWAAVNYLMEKLQETGNEPEDEQVSALDLGGASVQVTTELSKNAQIWPTVNITIFNNTYKVYSKSFLCYGIGEAMHRYQYLLVHNGTKAVIPRVVLNPCLPKGFEVSFSSDHFLKPCVFSNETRGMSPSLPSPNNYLKRFEDKYIHRNSSGDTFSQADESPAKSNGSTTYILKGSSDKHSCRKNVESLFDYELCKDTFVVGDCLNKKLVPPYKGELVGFSSIFRILLPLLGVTNQGSLHSFKEAVLKTCSKSAKELKAMHLNISNHMLEDLCFDGMYVYTLLRMGLGITPKGWKHILFTDKVNEQDVVWALGLMLNRTSSLKPQDTTPGINVIGFSLMVLLFSSFLVVGLLFFWYSFQIKRKGNVYQRVHAKELEQYLN